MPRTGRPFSVRMSNCGELGWISDEKGYRRQPTHPETGAEALRLAAADAPEIVLLLFYTSLPTA